MHNWFQRAEIDKIGQIDSERLRRLYDYWCSKMSGAARPKWGDLDLMDIYDVAPFVYVKDPTPDGRDFFYRYWGTGLVNRLGYEISGKLASDYYHGERLEMTTVSHMNVLNAGEPLLSSGNVIWTDDREHLTYVALFLPTDGDTAPLRHLMVGMDLDPH